MIMIEISVSNDIKAICPDFEFRAISCKVNNSKYNSELWKEIDEYSQYLRENLQLSDIKNRPAILATRMAYKELGKEPNRYRPSAEALCRRILKGDNLYQIDTLVDLINLVSLRSGFSIGGFDADKITGNLTLGVGKANEPFNAIGRGLLNIENLPVYRDDIGGIGTPTSDEERTKITSQTKSLLMIINGYSGKENLDKTAEYTISLLKKYTNAVEIIIYN